MKNPYPFPADYPALGLVDVEPGASIDVDDAEAAVSLLQQGHEPTDKEARDLLKLIEELEQVPGDDTPQELEQVPGDDTPQELEQVPGDDTPQEA
jgi:hypothetical protein